MRIVWEQSLKMYVLKNAVVGTKVENIKIVVHQYTVVFWVAINYSAKLDWESKNRMLSKIFANILLTLWFVIICQLSNSVSIQLDKTFPLCSAASWQPRMVSLHYYWTADTAPSLTAYT